MKVGVNERERYRRSRQNNTAFVALLDPLSQLILTHRIITNELPLVIENEQIHLHFPGTRLTRLRSATQLFHPNGSMSEAKLMVSQATFVK